MLATSLFVFVTTPMAMAEREGLNDSKSPMPPSRDCSLVGIPDNLNLDQLDANKVEIELPQMSAEGGTAAAYRLNGRIKFVHVGLYGETGQTEFIYQFATSDWNIASVKVTETNYMMPLGQEPFQLASVAVHKFTLCDGKNANFPNMREIERPANMAASVLQTLKEVIPERSR